MTISIVIPVHNNQSTIEKCLQSILKQPSNHQFEIICVDDHSTDRSCSVINDLPVKLVSSNGFGVSAARNTGLSIASGDYVWFIDADDWLNSNVIDCKLLSLLTQKNSDMFVIGLDKINKGKITVICNSKLVTYDAQSVSSDIFSQNIINCVWNKLYKKDFLIANKCYFPSYSIGEDALFNYAVLQKASSITTIPLVIYCFNMSSSSSTKTRWKSDQLTASICMAQSLLSMYQNTNYLSKYMLSQQLLELIISNQLNFLHQPDYSFQRFLGDIKSQDMDKLYSLARRFVTGSTIWRYLFIKSKLVSYFYLKHRFL